MNAGDEDDRESLVPRRNNEGPAECAPHNNLLWLVASVHRVHIERPVQERPPGSAHRTDQVRTAAGSHLAAGELQVPEAHRSVPGRTLCDATNQIEPVSGRQLLLQLNFPFLLLLCHCHET